MYISPKFDLFEGVTSSQVKARTKPEISLLKEEYKNLKIQRI